MREERRSARRGSGEGGVPLRPTPLVFQSLVSRWAGWEVRTTRCCMSLQVRLVLEPHGGQHQNTHSSIHYPMDQGEAATEEPEQEEETTKSTNGPDDTQTEGSSPDNNINSTLGRV